MELVNATKMLATYTIGLTPDGREHLVVIVKGSFVIPPKGGVLEPADEHDPFVFADAFTGKPGESATTYEADFAPHKPMCDVLLLGFAHAPEGKPTAKVPVALRIAGMTKHFEVVGRRYWTSGLLGVVPSSPEPFTSMPISYDRAYGGGEALKKRPELRQVYAPNPVGVGHLPESRGSEMFGKWLPNTQEFGAPVVDPRGKYRPMSFGPIGRNFEARIRLAGTYDDAWLAEQFPFLPPDFDLRYHQAAPADQQIAYPRGGEMVQFVNLTASYQAPFLLPTLQVPVEFSPARGERVEKEAVIDTVIIEPDRARVNLVWRASLPLKRNIHEVKQLVVGRMPRGWYRARLLGKRYAPSLRHLQRPGP